MTVEERKLLARRIGRLSRPVLVRLISYGIAVLKAVEAIACRYFCECFYSSYEPIHVIFDKTVSSGTREELVLRDALFGWIEQWTHRAPLKIPANLGESHPLVCLYARKESERWVFDLRKMSGGKISFEDSRHAWQFQMADFVANTWAQTLADHDLKRGFHSLDSIRPELRNRRLLSGEKFCLPDLSRPNHERTGSAIDRRERIFLVSRKSAR
jgi:hypothetical protein